MAKKPDVQLSVYVSADQYEEMEAWRRQKEAAHGARVSMAAVIREWLFAGGKVIGWPTEVSPAKKPRR